MSQLENDSGKESYLRKLQYRSLIEDVQTQDVANTKKTTLKAECVLIESNKLFNASNVEEKVKYPSENVLDSKLILMTSDLINRCAESISGNSNIYISANLAESFEKEDCNIPLLYDIPIFYSLYGTFDSEPITHSQRKPRKRVEKQAASSLSQPEKLLTVEKANDGSEAIAKVFKFLKKSYRDNNNKPINFFKFILHPDDFGRTIENIYHVSFLVRDVHVGLEVDKTDGLPYIYPISSDIRKQIDIRDTQQFIFSLDMNEWREAVRVFDIQRPFLNIEYK